MIDASFENHKDDNKVLALNQMELDSCFEALEAFQQTGFEEFGCGGILYGCPVNENLNPNALLKLFNKALENNCIK